MQAFQRYTITVYETYRKHVFTCVENMGSGHAVDRAMRRTFGAEAEVVPKKLLLATKPWESGEQRKYSVVFQRKPGAPFEEVTATVKVEF